VGVEFRDIDFSLSCTVCGFCDGGDGKKFLTELGSESRVRGHEDEIPEKCGDGVSGGYVENC